MFNVIRTSADRISLMLTCKELVSCHPTPFACHSERSEESPHLFSGSSNMKELQRCFAALSMTDSWFFHTHIMGSALDGSNSGGGLGRRGDDGQLLNFDLRNPPAVHLC